MGEAAFLILAIFSLLTSAGALCFGFGWGRYTDLPAPWKIGDL